jgi:hypothetical protein
VTTHFNGQSTVDLNGDDATGESYTIARHLVTANGERNIMVASLRDLDSFAVMTMAQREAALDSSAFECQLTVKQRLRTGSARLWSVDVEA